MIWLDRAVLAVLDRVISVVSPRHAIGLRQEFDRSLALARRGSSEDRRVPIDDARSPQPDLIRLLAGFYLALAAVLAAVALLLLPEAGSPPAGWWGALAALVISPWLGQAVWHGVVNAGRLNAGDDDEWFGTVTNAPLAALLLDGAIAVVLWAALR